MILRRQRRRLRLVLRARWGFGPGFGPRPGTGFGPGPGPLRGMTTSNYYLCLDMIEPSHQKSAGGFVAVWREYPGYKSLIDCIYPLCDFESIGHIKLDELQWIKWKFFP